LHVLSAPPAFVLSQDQTLHRVRTALGTNVVTLVRIFVLTVSPLAGTQRTRCLFPASLEAFRATGRPVQALLNTLIVNSAREPLTRLFPAWQSPGFTRCVAFVAPASRRVLQANPHQPARQPLGLNYFSQLRVARLSPNSIGLRYLQPAPTDPSRRFRPARRTRH